MSHAFTLKLKPIWATRIFPLPPALVNPHAADGVENGITLLGGPQAQIDVKDLPRGDVRQSKPTTVPAM